MGTGGGTTYTWEPMPMKRSSKTWKIGLDVDGTDIEIYPRSGDTVEGYSFADAVRMGLFDRATVQVHRAFWAKDSSTVDPQTVELFMGKVGEAQFMGVTAVLKVEPLTSLLDIGMPRNLFQGPCTNCLFDANCGLDSDDWDVTGAVASGSNARIIKLSGNAATKAAGYFKLGMVEITSGTYDGVKRRIKGHAGKNIQVFPPLASAPAAGVTLRLWPGCNKTKATCTTRFNNFAQFRGCPHIPVAETAA